MKKKTTGLNPQVDKISSVFNPQNPLLYRGEECPNGLTISVAPSDSTVTSVSANTNVSFKVSASGCKYGYDVIPEALDQIPLTPSSIVTDPIVRMAIPYSAIFSRSFASSGAQSFRVYVFPKNSTGSYTAFFVQSGSITVQAQASSLNCSISPGNFYVSTNLASRDVILTVSSNAGADKAPKLVSIIGSGGYASVNRPFSNLALPATVVVNVPGSTSGALQATVQTNDSQTINCQASGNLQVPGVVSGNFVGRGASETIKDRFYFGETVGTNRYLRVDYAKPDGFFVTSVLSTQLPLTDLPESLLAGDLDRDGKDDVLLYKSGSFRWMKSVGTDYSSYSFNAPVGISGSWPQSLQMKNMVFVRGADANTPHKIKGTINGQRYFATIDTNSVSQPQPELPSTTISVSSTSVNAGHNFSVSWSASNVAGFSCKLQRKLVSATTWDLVGQDNLPGSGSEVALRTETQSITGNTNYRVLCSKVENGVTTHVGDQDIRTVTAAFQSCSIAVSRVNGSESCSITASNFAQGPILKRDGTALQVAWNAAGSNSFSTTAPCPSGQDSVFSVESGLVGDSRVCKLGIRKWSRRIGDGTEDGFAHTAIPGKDLGDFDNDVKVPGRWGGPGAASVECAMRSYLQIAKENGFKNVVNASCTHRDGRTNYTSCGDNTHAAWLGSSWGSVPACSVKWAIYLTVFDPIEPNYSVP